MRSDHLLKIQGFCHACCAYVTTRPVEIHPTRDATWRLMNAVSTWASAAPASAVACWPTHSDRHDLAQRRKVEPLCGLSSAGWRYRETRNDPPADWKTAGFDDSSPAATEWLPCKLPAGFATGTQFSPAVSFNTTPGYGSDSGGKTKAYYFRKTFTVDDPAAFSALTFKVRRDDGLVMWLNADSEPTVVSASDSFTGPYTYDGLAPNNDESSEFQSYSVPASKLVAGTNIIAIALHPSSLTSSDILLDCELIAIVIPPLELMLTTSGVDFLLYWFDSGAMLEESTDLGFWTPMPTATRPLPFQPMETKRFYCLRC